MARKSGKKYTFPKALGRSGSKSPESGARREARGPTSGRRVYNFPSTAPNVSGANALGVDGALGYDTGWHFDEETKTGPRWTCDYGCKSHVWPEGPQPWAYHTPDCPYWTREGKEGRPVLFSTTRVPLHVPWRCKYGCAPFIWTNGPFPGQYHRFDCNWWNAEGGLATPFDGA